MTVQFLASMASSLQNLVGRDGLWLPTRQLDTLHEEWHLRKRKMARLGLDNFIDETVVKRLLGSHEEIAIRVFL